MQAVFPNLHVRGVHYRASMFGSRHAVAEEEAEYGHHRISLGHEKVGVTGSVTSARAEGSGSAARGTSTGAIVHTCGGHGYSSARCKRSAATIAPPHHRQLSGLLTCLSRALDRYSKKGEAVAELDACAEGP
jgi:hypothetical protein